MEMQVLVDIYLLGITSRDQCSAMRHYHEVYPL
jgi:hypothetical protein